MIGDILLEVGAIVAYILFIIFFAVVLGLAFHGNRKAAHIIGRVGSGIFGGLTVFIVLDKDPKFRLGYLVLMLAAIGFLIMEFFYGNESKRL